MIAKKFYIEEPKTKKSKLVSVISWPSDPSRDFVSHHNDILLNPPIALTYYLVPDGSLF